MSCLFESVYREDKNRGSLFDPPSLLKKWRLAWTCRSLVVGGVDVVGLQLLVLSESTLRCCMVDGLLRALNNECKLKLLVENVQPSIYVFPSGSRIVQVQRYHSHPRRSFFAYFSSSQRRTAPEKSTQDQREEG
jgi:hypothetical protein